MEDQELKEAAKGTRQRALTIAEILRGSEYSLTLFSAEEVASLELFDRSGKPYLNLRSFLQTEAGKARGDRKAALSAQIDK
ncbi:MAG: hypothetical protein WA623_17380 [Candidatus Sulfotelmatobacter sp.]